MFPVGLLSSTRHANDFWILLKKLLELATAKFQRFDPHQSIHSLLGETPKRRFALLRYASSCLFVHSTRKQLLEYLENRSPNCTRTSILTLSTAAADMTSLSTSGWKVQGKKQSIIPPPAASGGISRMVLQTRFAKFYTLIEDNRPHKHAGNGVTSCFRLAAKCY